MKVGIPEEKVVSHFEGWKAQQLRLTFFLDQPHSIHPSAIWALLTGSEPDTAVEKKKEGSLQERGAWQQGSLQVLQAFQRTDVIFSGADQDGMPNLGDLRSAADILSTLSFPDSLLKVVRLAFGAICFAPADDLDGAYTILRKFLPTVKLSPGTSDFLYQINRPVKSTVSDFSINRLSKWSALEIRHLNFPDAVVLSKFWAAQVELDVNTAIEPLLSSIEVDPRLILKELIELSLKIGIEGDQE